MADTLAVSESWSFWDRPIPSSVPRNVDLPTKLRDSLALVVQGVRRCGKSTLLQQLVGRYDLNPQYCAFVNFEDPRLANALTHHTLDELVSAFRKRHRRVRRLYFFLDEIQWVDGWQRWLRSQLDRGGGNHFVVTGSNGQLLSGELATSLTGRHLPIELFPFDILEAQQHTPRLDLEKYLNQGGFPEPAAIVDGDRLRRQYFTDIVERDVRERLGARSSLPIRQVVQMVFESAGSELSLRRVAGAAGIAVETAAGYLQASEAAHLLFACPYFAFSERKRATRNRKYYPVDSGLRRVVVTRTGADLGKALECATFIALRRRFREVFYWRQRSEVDFVVHDAGRFLPVQVSWTGATDRHERALTEFYEIFPQAEEALVVTKGSFQELFGVGPGHP
jgi:predicted AAA+ superfamily ATPase